MTVILTFKTASLHGGDGSGQASGSSKNMRLEAWTHDKSSGSTSGRPRHRAGGGDGGGNIAARNMFALRVVGHHPYSLGKFQVKGILLCPRRRTAGHAIHERNPERDVARDQSFPGQRACRMAYQRI